MTRVIPTIRIAIGLTLLAGLVATAGVLMPAQAAGATTIAVTNCADSGPGSLRQAVTSASPGDTITFALSPPCSTITLASTIDINTSVTIRGPGSNALAVSGANAVQVLNVASGVIATITGLTIEDGGGSQEGGGIYDAGTLTVNNSTLSNNTAVSNFGGGVYDYGTLTVNNSDLSDNSAILGGGIYNAYSTLTVNNSTLSNNTVTNSGGGIWSGGSLTVTKSTLSANDATNTGVGGGGIYQEGNRATITNSTLSDNHTSFVGGGIENNGGMLTVTNSTLTGNSSSVGGSGIWNNGSVIATDSTFSGNTTTNNGGGVDNSGTMTVAESTFSDNVASGYGGAIENDNATLTVSNSTLSENSSSDGGAVYNLYDAGTVNLNSSTVADNAGGGIYNLQGTVKNAATILARSTVAADCSGDGTFSDLGYNLDDDGSCGFSGTSLSDTPAGLDPAGLQHNGGPTETVSLLGTSAATDHVKAASLCPATDQRGFARRAPCDIGAYDTDGFGIITSSLPAGAPRVHYSATLAAIGGNPPYRWSVSSGRLPKGLHLKKSTGVMSGAPKKADAGTYAFTVKVVDKKIKTKHHPASRNAATAVLSITIS